MMSSRCRHLSYPSPRNRAELDHSQRLSIPPLPLSPHFASWRSLVRTSRAPFDVRSIGDSFVLWVPLILTSSALTQPYLAPSIPVTISGPPSAPRYPSEVYLQVRVPDSHCSSVGVRLFGQFWRKRYFEAQRAGKSGCSTFSARLAFTYLTVPSTLRRLCVNDL